VNLAKSASFTVLVLSLVALSACSNAPRTSEAVAPETLSNVPVAIVQTATVPEYLEAVGTVRAAQTSQISSQAMGNIVEISAREGDRVQAGQVLARIDDAQPRVAVEQATAALTAAEKESVAADTDLALAESTLKRYQQLYDKKSLSPQEYDEVKARYQSAEARRDMARAAQAQASAALVQAQTSLAYTNVRAPFSGRVTEKKVDAGAFASPGMPIFTIEDTRTFRLEVTVDESDIAVAHMGQPVAVTIDSLGPAQISARVAEIIPAADPASRSFLVKIALPGDARIRSGLFGRAYFSRGARSALLIPAASVLQRGQLQGVYALDANRIVSLRYVTLGKPVADKVEVLSGLHAGEKLIAAPGDREFAGKRIVTQP
jgi:RND family efflux transporter MFP subunit